MAMTRRFPSTSWTLIRQAATPGEPGQRHALQAVLERYLPILRTYLVRCRNLSEHDADDRLQGFVCDKVIGNELLQKVDEARGKFRTFLLASLDHYLVEHHRHLSSGKRGGGVPTASVIDTAQDGVAGDSRTAEQEFELAWAREVLAEALQRMEAQCRQSGRADLWTLFEMRIVGPMIDGVPAVPYEQIVSQLGLASPIQASNALITAKRMYSRMLRDAVSQYVRDDRPDAIDAELDELRRIFREAAQDQRSFRVCSDE
jgi:RNA polymerase sigma-70 factor (ECF subfamily)